MRLDLKTLKAWMLDSLNIIKDKNNDALLLGGFSGSVIEFLGRLLKIHAIDEHSKCFSDFLKNYLPNYFPYSDVLYSILRSEGAHAVLAQTAIDLTCHNDLRDFHLKCNYDQKKQRYSLIIYSPQLVSDLIQAVEKFFSDVEGDSFLEGKCQEVYRKIYRKGQCVIEKEINSGKLKVETNFEVQRG